MTYFVDWTQLRRWAIQRHRRGWFVLAAWLLQEAVEARLAVKRLRTRVKESCKEMQRFVESLEVRNRDLPSSR